MLAQVKSQRKATGEFTWDAVPKTATQKCFYTGDSSPSIAPPCRNTYKTLGTISQLVCRELITPFMSDSLHRYALLPHGCLAYSGASNQKSDCKNCKNHLCYVCGKATANALALDAVLIQKITSNVVKESGFKQPSSSRFQMNEGGSLFGEVWVMDDILNADHDMT